MSYFGVFKVIFPKDGSESQAKMEAVERALDSNVYRSIMFDRAKGAVYENRNCKELKQQLKEWTQYELEAHTSIHFITKFYIHMCDKAGWLVATDKEKREFKKKRSKTENESQANE